MENDAESIISSEEKKEALRRSRGYFKISGVLYGAFDEDSTNEAVISGITIGILGKFQSQTLISGISGDFESGDLPEGKYTLSFRDPSQKYSHSPIKLNLLKDIYLPVHMLLPGADKKGRRGSNLRSALSGIVLNRKKKPIPGAIITINSLTIEKKGQNILGKALSKIFPRFIKGQEKPVSINLTTNILGMFSLGRSVPKGSYIVRCSDKSGQYRFSSKFIVIRDKSFPFIVFIGYSSSDLEELREKLEKEMGEFPQVQKQPESIPNQKVGSVRQVFIRTNYLRPLSNVAGRSSSFALRGTGRIISGGLSNATNAINYLAQVIRAGSIAARALAVLGSTPVGWVVGAAIAVALIIILLVLFFMRGSPSFPSELGEAAPVGGERRGGTGSIASCVFYRGPEPELKFGNPEMAQYVESVSAKVGVPAAVVAGIMRVESGGKLARVDPAYFASDYDDTSSGVAYGIMQFTPGTFLGTFARNATELNTIFGKTDARAEIDPQQNVFPTNYLRIYSIMDSIIATAFKVKNDKQSINGDGPWDQATVYEIARRYYGCLLYPSCSDGPYNYGEDVWRSYSNCQAAPATELAITCPLDPIGNTAFVTCGTAARPVNLCGHGGLGYPACTQPPYAVCPYSEQLKNAIDVVSRNGSGVLLPVYLPLINGSVAQWRFEGGLSIPLDGGWRQMYNAEFNGHSINLELTHLSEARPGQIDAPIESKTQVATTYSGGNPHLHIGVTVDGKPVDPIADLFMCAQ